MKGYKTVLFGLLLAIAPAGLTYLAGVDWTQYVSPNVAGLIAGAIVIALRAVTTTPIGKSDNSVQFTPTGRKLVVGFLMIGGALLMVTQARAADLKLPAKAIPFATGTPCTQSYCVGIFIGGNIVNEGANFDVLGSGLNGLASNGITLGGEVGAEYWNGKLFAAIEGDLDGSVTQNGPGLGLSNHVSERILGKIGYSLSAAFGGGATGAIPNPVIPSSLSAAMMTPYFIIGTEHQPWGWGLSTGAGVQALIATNWTLSADYIHTNFNNAALNSKVSEQTDNAFVLHLDYHINP